MFESFRKRIRLAQSGPKSAMARAADLVVAKFRADATTRRGNVPSFGRMGDVPIRASVRPQAINVSGPNWCIEKARERGQTKDWRNIIAEELNTSVRR
jgi:hypothetical protein